MPLKDLTLRRISTAQYPFRFNHPIKAFCITNHDTMAEESKNKDVEVEPGKLNPTTSNINKIEENDRKTSEKSPPKPVPPPPEKPLPGDCCDSGCVRCVWDIYYDELEEYSKLYKDDSKAS